MQQFPVKRSTPRSERKVNFACSITDEEKYEEKEVNNVDPVIKYLRSDKTHRRSIVNARDSTEHILANPDDIVLCDSCQVRYVGDCPVHGPLQHIHDKPLPPGYHEADRAIRTMPDEFELRASGIAGADLGVWTKQKINKRVVFHSYEGIKRPPDHENIMTYTWQIRGYGCEPYRIDADDPRYSNWLRYINCARNPEEQNLIPFQYKGRIYYRTFKDIPPNTELLVYYGHNFAKELDIEPFHLSGFE